MAYFVIEINRVGIPVARVDTKVDVPKIQYHLLTDVGEIENEGIDVLIAIG